MCVTGVISASFIHWHVLIHPSSGGDLRDGNPADEIPRVAPVWLLPGAGVGLQASDSGHTGGTAFCHRRGSGPCDWYMCQQHCAVPTTVQQDRGVSDAAALYITTRKKLSTPAGAYFTNTDMT